MKQKIVTNLNKRLTEQTKKEIVVPEAIRKRKARIERHRLLGMQMDTLKELGLSSSSSSSFSSAPKSKPTTANTGGLLVNIAKKTTESKFFSSETLSG